MEDNTEYNERAYTTGEMANMIGISVPTVRKYAQSLEHKGYSFIRSKGNARLYVERDVMALRYLKEIRNKSNITVEQATNIVVERFRDKAIQTVRPTDTPETELYNKQYEELKAMIEQQNEVIKGLSTQLREHQEYINDRLNKRDNALMQRLDNSLKEQKQIEAKKKGLFKRLFKK